MGLLDGKNIVITGVLTDASLAFGVAKIARDEGAEPRAHRRRPGPQPDQAHGPQARRQADGSEIPVFELDVTDPSHVDAVRDAVAEQWGRVDGVLHAIGFAPQALLGDDFMGATWDDVAVALHVSTYSLKALADAFVPLMTAGGSFVGLDFDNSVTFPAYNWMGVAKSALQSLNRYLARELGPQGHPLQPRRRRPGADDGGQEHPRVRPVRGHLGRAGAARLGHQRPRAGRQGVRRAAVGLVPGDHRRDRPRRRRLPLHRRRRRARRRAAVRPCRTDVDEPARRPRRRRTCASTATTRSTGTPWGAEAFAAARRARRADPAVGRLLGVPLVPRDGPRVVRGRRRRGGDERARSSTSRSTARNGPTSTRSTWMPCRR